MKPTVEALISWLSSSSNRLMNRTIEPSNTSVISMIVANDEPCEREHLQDPSGGMHVCYQCSLQLTPWHKHHPHIRAATRAVQS